MTNFSNHHFEFIFMMPNYLQIWGIAKTFDVSLKEFYLKPENTWRPDLDELNWLISPRTRLISVCHPNNPTGYVLKEQEMEELVSIADRHHLWLHSNEVYRGAEPEGNETPSFWGRYDRVMVTAGLSKAYGLSGLRIGWIMAPESIIEKAWEAHDYTCIAAVTLSQHLANYSPDGRFYRIEIKVKRPHLRVIHRSGYFAD